LSSLNQFISILIEFDLTDYNNSVVKIMTMNDGQQISDRYSLKNYYQRSSKHNISFLILYKTEIVCFKIYFTTFHEKRDTLHLFSAKGRPTFHKQNDFQPTTSPFPFLPRSVRYPLAGRGEEGKLFLLITFNRILYTEIFSNDFFRFIKSFSFSLTLNCRMIKVNNTSCY